MAINSPTIAMMLWIALTSATMMQPLLSRRRSKTKIDRWESLSRYLKTGSISARNGALVLIICQTLARKMQSLLIQICQTESWLIQLSQDKNDPHSNRVSVLSLRATSASRWQLRSMVTQKTDAIPRSFSKTSRLMTWWLRLERTAWMTSARVRPSLMIWMVIYRRAALVSRDFSLRGAVSLLRVSKQGQTLSWQTSTVWLIECSKLVRGQILEETKQSSRGGLMSRWLEVSRFLASSSKTSWTSQELRSSSTEKGKSQWCRWAAPI